MPRGGKRPGAGRPTTIDDDVRDEIGIECDRLARAFAEADMKARIARTYDGMDLEESLRLIRKVPVKDRQLVVELATRKSDTSRRLPPIITDAVEHLRYRREILSKLGRSFPLKRAYGHRYRIISDAAAWAMKRFKRPISRRLVERCWKEYRRKFPAFELGPNL